MTWRNIITKHKEHLLPTTIIIGLALIFYHNFLSFSNTRLGEIINNVMAPLAFIRESILVYHQFPLWLPSNLGGLPFYPHPFTAVIFYTTPLALFMPVTGVVNLSIILFTVIAGLSMYSLMIHFKLKPRYALLSAIGYMFSHFALTLTTGDLQRYYVYALAPLVLLFAMKALYSKEWIRNSIIVGIILSIQLLSGGTDTFISMVVIFVCLYLFYFFNKNIAKRFKKVVFVSCVIGLVFFGLTAVKLLPMLEFSKTSSKGQAFSYEQSVGKTILLGSPKDIFHSLIEARDEYNVDPDYAELGLMGFILMLISFTQWRRKTTLFLLFLALISFLFIAGTPLYYLFWKFVPGIDRTHHAARSAYLFILPAYALAGIGFSILSSKLSSRYQDKKKWLRFLPYAIIVLFILNLWVSPFTAAGDRYFVSNLPKLVVPKDTIQEHLNSQELWHYLKEDNDIFRVHSIGATNINGVAGSYATFLNHEILYGGVSVWIPDMLIYLQLAERAPARFWGMLNTKYISSDDPVNISGLTLERTFENQCDFCAYMGSIDSGIDGPYLYRNEYYLPRAYLVEHALLIVGSQENALQAMYGLMLHEQFNPANTALIMGPGTIDQYDLPFLQSFDAVLLTQGALNQQSDMSVLRAYIDEGGNLLPNVVEGETSVSEQTFSTLFSSFEGNYDQVQQMNLSLYTPNKRIVNINGQRGFLVLSDKYYLFPGWKVSLGGPKQAFRANGVNSAVLLNGEKGELTMSYQPRSFKVGLIISTLALLALFAYGFMRMRIKN